MIAPEHTEEWAAAGPDTDEGGPPRGRVAAPRLARHTITLDDGHRVQIAVAGRGVPFVVVHGFSAEGLLYAQTLSRLVSAGFKVVAIDTAGHGGTAGFATGGGELSGYGALLGRAVDHLGIRRALYGGHSMGGRLVAELISREPRRAIAVMLIDAIVGESWDRRVTLSRFFPPLMAMTGIGLVVDTISTAPVLRNPRQALKLGRLWAPVAASNILRPQGLVGAAVSILRSGPSRWLLEAMADHLVPTYVIHGDRDYPVPVSTARDAARRTRGELILVHGASHSWLLRDPEAMPAIVAELLEGSLGDVIRLALAVEGAPIGTEETIEDIERALYTPGALVHALT
ncbi:MAG TPA: alpha/beta hydrolase, partial [Acidimicrobiales bacterium]|nr:alpha/beta hydrolase [Acidimicrobiales bacterium]